MLICGKIASLNDLHRTSTLRNLLILGYNYHQSSDNELNLSVSYSGSLSLLIQYQFKLFN